MGLENAYYLALEGILCYCISVEERGEQISVLIDNERSGRNTMASGNRTPLNKLNQFPGSYYLSNHF